MASPVNNLSAGIDKFVLKAMRRAQPTIIQCNKYIHHRLNSHIVPRLLAIVNVNHKSHQLCEMCGSSMRGGICGVRFLGVILSQPLPSSHRDAEIGIHLNNRTERHQFGTRYNGIHLRTDVVVYAAIVNNDRRNIDGLLNATIWQQAEQKNLLFNVIQNYDKNEMKGNNTGISRPTDTIQYIHPAEPHTKKSKKTRRKARITQMHRIGCCNVFDLLAYSNGLMFSQSHLQKTCLQIHLSPVLSMPSVSPIILLFIRLFCGILGLFS